MFVLKIACFKYWFQPGGSSIMNIQSSVQQKHVSLSNVRKLYTCTVNKVHQSLWSQ